MTDRELMQMALDIFDWLESRTIYQDGAIKELHQALRDRLAQPEQEPVDVVKVEHDKQVELAQAYERGWNAALTHEQEPVAWMSDHDVDFKKSSFGTYPCVPLYTAPPKREWVGLTDEEAWEMLRQMSLGASVEDVRFVEAKLKEKNI